jgi:hypothetical protein
VAGGSFRQGGVRPLSARSIGQLPVGLLGLQGGGLRGAGGSFCQGGVRPLSVRSIGQLLVGLLGLQGGGVCGGSEMTFGLGWFDPVGPWYLPPRKDVGSLAGLDCSGPARGGGFGFHSHL